MHSKRCQARLHRALKGRTYQYPRKIKEVLQRIEEDLTRRFGILGSDVYRIAPATAEGGAIFVSIDKVEGGVRWAVIPRVDDERVVLTHDKVTLFSQGLQV